MPQTEALRVGFIVGSLVQGGAEKQLVYLVKALAQAGVQVRLFTLTRGEYYDAILRNAGFDMVWIGQRGSPLLRIGALASAVRHYRPHFLQSSCYFVNLYTALVSWLSGAVSIGSIRNDAYLEMAYSGRWGKLLLKTPRALLVNSHQAARNTVALGAASEKVHVLLNGIDLQGFDKSLHETDTGSGLVEAMMVCRLVSEKRVDRFLWALSEARKRCPNLHGTIVGDGPERKSLQGKAEELGLLPEGVVFRGRRDDVPSLLQKADMFVVASDHEGFPNVILEAMAARLPVITTCAGDAPEIVQDGFTGFVVQDENLLLDRMVYLAREPALRQQLGQAGRQRVESLYSTEHLAANMLQIYAALASRHKKMGLIQVVEAQLARLQPAAG